jgi:hypothetical protein
VLDLLHIPRRQLLVQHILHNHHQLLLELRKQQVQQLAILEVMGQNKKRVSQLGHSMEL